MSERERVAEELRRIREGVRERALLEPSRESPPPPEPVRIPHTPQEGAAAGAESAPGHEPQRPDNAPLNTLWRVSGERGLLRRLWERMLRGTLGRQQAFNARQVQFDNELLAYLEARFEQTHRHYDAILGLHGRHMEEIDERHLILQEELVAHVHDLIKRIDLALSHGERGRLSLEFALRDVRARLTRLEERILGKE
jgi:hypothetical protein